MMISEENAAVQSTNADRALRGGRSVTGEQKDITVYGRSIEITKA